MKNLIRLALVVMLFGCDRAEQKGPTVPMTASLTSPGSSTGSLSEAEFNFCATAVKRFYDSAFSRRRFNGSILVAKNGEIVFEQYVGFTDPRTRKDTISPSTPFHLASVSKTFTGMAVMKLQEEGKLHIDDTIGRFLPGFPSPAVTIRSLLNHRSGLPNYVHYMERLGWDRKQFVTNQDVLNFIMARHKDIDIGAADRRFSYSNTNYALLALIIEKASGAFYGDYLRKTFFQPLGMKDTYVFTQADSARALPSFFYSGRQYGFDYLDLVYGDKNIYSTVRDLLKWNQALQSGLLFKKETLDEAYKPYSFEKPGKNNYGLGWRMNLLPGNKKLIFHNGWWHGNRTAFYRLLDENAVIIALSNNDNTLVYKTKHMADIFGHYLQDPADDRD